MEIEGTIQRYNGEFKYWGDSLDAFGDSIGKTITEAGLIDDALVLRFGDGTALSITDEGQSCCEHRYITTDDNFNEFVGSTLIGGSTKESTIVDDEDDYNVHDTMFLEILTSTGAITLVTHNEHNGYYGGFSVQCKAL